MTSFPIQLTSVSDIKTFVDAASRLDCDVDVICGRYLIGMFCLGLGIGAVLGGLIPLSLLLVLCGAGLIALGVILLAQ